MACKSFDEFFADVLDPIKDILGELKNGTRRIWDLQGQLVVKIDDDDSVIVEEEYEGYSTEYMDFSNDDDIEKFESMYELLRNFQNKEGRELLIPIVWETEVSHYTYKDGSSKNAQTFGKIKIGVYNTETDEVEVPLSLKNTLDALLEINDSEIEYTINLNANCDCGTVAYAGVSKLEIASVDSGYYYLEPMDAACAGSSIPLYYRSSNISIPNPMLFPKCAAIVHPVAPSFNVGKVIEPDKATIIKNCGNLDYETLKVIEKNIDSGTDQGTGKEWTRTTLKYRYEATIGTSNRKASIGFCFNNYLVNLLNDLSNKIVSPHGSLPHYSKNLTELNNYGLGGLGSLGRGIKVFDKGLEGEIALSGAVYIVPKKIYVLSSYICFDKNGDLVTGFASEFKDLFDYVFKSSSEVYDVKNNIISYNVQQHEIEGVGYECEYEHIGQDYARYSVAGFPIADECPSQPVYDSNGWLISDTIDYGGGQPSPDSGNFSVAKFGPWGGDNLFSIVDNGYILCNPDSTFPRCTHWIDLTIHNMGTELSNDKQDVTISYEENPCGHPNGTLTFSSSYITVPVYGLGTFSPIFQVGTDNPNFRSKLDAAVNAAISHFESTVRNIESTFEQNVEEARSGLHDLKTQIQNIPTKLDDEVGDIQNRIDSAVSSASTALDNVGDSTSKLNVAVNRIKNNLDKRMNSMKLTVTDLKQKE